MNSQLRLFRTPFESLNLYFPILLLILSASEIFWGTRLFWSYGNVLQYIQDIIFFNALHICFTFLLLIFPLAGQAAFQNFVSTLGAWGLARVAFVFLGTTLGYFMFSHFLDPQSGWQFILAAVFTFTRRHHDLSQSKGLLRIFNNHVAKSGISISEKQHLKKIQQWETQFIRVFYWASCISTLSFFNVTLIGPKIGPIVFKSSFAIAIGCILGLIICGLQSPRVGSLWKFLYSLRFITKIIGPFSAISAYAGASVHGVEYFCVTDKILEQDKMRNQRSIKNAVLFGFCLFAILIPFALIRYPLVLLPSLNAVSDKLWIDLLLGLAAGAIFTHYFLDHLLFTPHYTFAKPLLTTLSEQFPSERSKSDKADPTCASNPMPSAEKGQLRAAKSDVPSSPSKR